MSDERTYIEVTDEMRAMAKRISALQATVAYSEKDFNCLTEEIRVAHAQIASVVIAAIEPKDTPCP